MYSGMQCTTLPAEKKLTATTFFTYFLFIFFFENPAPDKILKQTKTPAPIKFQKSSIRRDPKMASLRHLCRSLQRSAKMPKMCGFASRNGCKDGIVHTGGISTIYLQCGRVHLCNIRGPFLLVRPSLCRLCGVFAVVFADLCCKDHAEHPPKNLKIPLIFL